MCKMKCCQRIDYLTGSVYTVPFDVWMVATEKLGRVMRHWHSTGQGRSRLSKALLWFEKHRPR